MTAKQVSASPLGVTIAWDTICTTLLVVGATAAYFAGMGLWAIALVPAYILGGLSFALFKGTT
jgi:hypothetical protein